MAASQSLTCAVALQTTCLRPAERKSREDIMLTCFQGLAGGRVTSEGSAARRCTVALSGALPPYMHQ